VLERRGGTAFFFRMAKGGVALRGQKPNRCFLWRKEKKKVTIVRGPSVSKRDRDKKKRGCLLLKGKKRGAFHQREHRPKEKRT